MTDKVEIKVPDIGDATDVDVIEILVSVGDQINKEDSLVTLESDKASMEVPASEGGVITSIALKVGDKVSEGTLILCLESEKKATTKPDKTNDAIVKNPTKKPELGKEKKDTATQNSTIDVLTPDIGDATDVDVIDVMVRVGDKISKEDPLITLEGDKATMDIPSPEAGTVKALKIKVGDRVSQGTLILTLDIERLKIISEDTQPPKKNAVSQPIEQPVLQEVKQPETLLPTKTTAKVYASPSVRRIAREFGVDLTLVEGTGRKKRIVPDDVKLYVKNRLSEPAGLFNIPKARDIDFSKYGKIELKPLNKIKRLTAQNMHRSWITVPHVTQFDEADITELEGFRQKEKLKAANEGYKLTPLAFIVKACVSALKKFPSFNASLDASGENLILKNYYNIGIAVDTENGLVVPVIKEAEKKSISEIARKMGELSLNARLKKLTPAEMSGGSFTISSLGGISGTAFTPIVNNPEVAILGVSRSKWQPVLKENDFIPRLMLPLSLSYDHRVVDGAEAARFTLYLTDCLTDIRTLLL